MSLRKLQNNMTKEFFTFTDPPPLAQLSYWPPNTKEFATGLTTPPVILTNDGGVSFFQHFSTNSSMNLFITFDTEGDNPHQTTADDSPHVPNYLCATKALLQVPQPLYTCTLTRHVQNLSIQTMIIHVYLYTVGSPRMMYTTRCTP